MHEGPESGWDENSHCGIEREAGRRRERLAASGDQHKWAYTSDRYSRAKASAPWDDDQTGNRTRAEFPGPVSTPNKDRAPTHSRRMWMHSRLYRRMCWQPYLIFTVEIYRLPRALCSTIAQVERGRQNTQSIRLPPGRKHLCNPHSMEINASY